MVIAFDFSPCPSTYSAVIGIDFPLCTSVPSVVIAFSFFGKDMNSMRGRTAVHQLQQNSSSALRMHEHITMSAGANLDLIRNQAHAS